MPQPCPVHSPCPCRNWAAPGTHIPAGPMDPSSWGGTTLVLCNRKVLLLYKKIIYKQHLRLNVLITGMCAISNLLPVINTWPLLGHNAKLLGALDKSCTGKKCLSCLWWKALKLLFKERPDCPCTCGCANVGSSSVHTCVSHFKPPEIFTTATAITAAITEQRCCIWAAHKEKAGKGRSMTQLQAW